MRPALLALLLLGCSHPNHPPPRVTPEPRVAVTPDVPPAPATAPPATSPPTPAPPPPPAAWTDPAAIAGLTRDCAFRAPHAEGDEDTLSCNYEVEQQSCTADPCPERVGAPCRRECAGTCTTCDTACRGSCERCHSACADDACREACGRTCGACLQGCLDARDRCFTATCTQRELQCSREVSQRFRRTCAGPCARCEERCQSSDAQGECVSACLRRARGCDAEQRAICAFEGHRFGEEPADTRAPDHGEGD